MLLLLRACMVAGQGTKAVLALQGKKEKRRREKKKEKEIIPIGPLAEEEPRQSTFFDELEREVSSTSCPGQCHLVATETELSHRFESAHQHLLHSRGG